MQVWRILFWAMAGLAILTCVVTGLMGVEPRRYLPKKEGSTALPGMSHEALDVWKDILMPDEAVSVIEHAS